MGTYKFRNCKMVASIVFHLFFIIGVIYNAKAAVTSAPLTIHHSRSHIQPQTRHPAAFPVASCALPPDFWCDNAAVALACTGTLTYCDRYRASRAGHRLQLELAFETACPDSQKSIIQRLYPKLLANPQLSPLIDFKAVPWGLAKRQSDQSVRCHHGERECVANRLLRCAQQLLEKPGDAWRRHALLNCFMSRMVYKADPLTSVEQCTDHVVQDAAATSLKANIWRCENGTQADELQRVDEASTQRIGPPPFVPFIGLNGRGHIHMQAYQMMLPEKVRHWDHTLRTLFITGSGKNGNASLARVQTARCVLPPEFWCSDPSIIAQCYNAAGCAAYARDAWQRPIHMRVLYNSASDASRRYVLDYLRPLFVNVARYSPLYAENSGKYVLELEPMPSNDDVIVGGNVGNCAATDANCARHSFEECIAARLNDTRERTAQLLCLLAATTSATTAAGVTDVWQRTCGARATPALRDAVMHCTVFTSEWRQLAAQRAAANRALAPEPPQRAPWLILNGYSLASVQPFQRQLHRLICVWYRGVGHDRDFCSRCEYEPTHC